MSNATVGRPTLHLKVLIRDKHGRPKIDAVEKIEKFRDQLTEEDMKYLQEKFDGEDICT